MEFETPNGAIRGTSCQEHERGAINSYDVVETPESGSLQYQLRSRRTFAVWLEDVGPFSSVIRLAVEDDELALVADRSYFAGGLENGRRYWSDLRARAACQDSPARYYLVARDSAGRLSVR